MIFQDACFFRRSLIILKANSFTLSILLNILYLSLGEGKDNEDGKHVDEDNQTDIPKRTKMGLPSKTFTGP